MFIDQILREEKKAGNSTGEEKNTTVETGRGLGFPGGRSAKGDYPIEPYHYDKFEKTCLDEKFYGMAKPSVVKKLLRSLHSKSPLVSLKQKYIHVASSNYQLDQGLGIKCKVERGLATTIGMIEYDG